VETSDDTSEASKNLGGFYFHLSVVDAGQENYLPGAFQNLQFFIIFLDKK